MAETLENYSFFDKGIFHILQDALQKVFQHVLSGESHLMMWYLKLGF